MDIRLIWDTIQGSFFSAVSTIKGIAFSINNNFISAEYFTLGNVLHALSQAFPPKSIRFSIDDIPDLTGTVILVTGGNTGIGRETIKALIIHNAKVYMAARNKLKSDAAIAALKRETGKEVLFLPLDLSNLASVRNCAQEFLRRETELHVLFNNAGVAFPKLELVTQDGYDLQFGTNVVGHFLLTKLLMPALLARVKTSSGQQSVRIVTTSSSAHLFGSLNFATFRDGPVRRGMTTENLYSQSKFANVVIAREMARRYGDQGIVSLSCNPGNLRSELFRHNSRFVRNLIWYVTYPVEKGALTQLWGGVSPEARDLNGAYLIPWARLGKADLRTADVELGKELWTSLEEEVRPFRI